MYFRIVYGFDSTSIGRSFRRGLGRVARVAAVGVVSYWTITNPVTRGGHFC